MRRLGIAVLALVGLGTLGPATAGAVEIESKAEKIDLTGRVHTQWNTTSVDGEPSNLFLLRRVRPSIKVKINDWISGVAEVDFGKSSTDVKDAYFKMEPIEDHLDVILGKTKRRFDLFELTSSTQMLVVERDGEIRGADVVSLSSLSEDLGYSDRDLGVFVMAHDGSDRYTVEAAVTNGVKGEPTFGEKAYQGRASVQPVADLALVLNGGVSAHPFQPVPTSEDIEYGIAFEGSAEWGSFKSGPHVQAGFVGGDNWTAYDTVAKESPNFSAVQGIAAYKHPLAGNRYLEAVEPVLRVGWADPNTDVDKDGGTLFTPGLNVYVSGRNRLSLNVDVYQPQADDDPGTVGVDESETVYSVKAQSWLYW